MLKLSMLSNHWKIILQMIDKYIDDFLKMMVAEKGASANTTEAYGYDLQQFFEICTVYDVKII